MCGNIESICLHTMTRASYHDTLRAIAWIPFSVETSKKICITVIQWSHRLMTFRQLYHFTPACYCINSPVIHSKNLCNEQILRLVVMFYWAQNTATIRSFQGINGTKIYAFLVELWYSMSGSCSTPTDTYCRLQDWRFWQPLVWCSLEDRSFPDSHSKRSRFRRQRKIWMILDFLLRPRSGPKAKWQQHSTWTFSWLCWMIGSLFI